MSMQMAELAEAVREVVRRDPRYAYEAYEFVFDALRNTQRLLGRLPKRRTPPAAPPSQGGDKKVSPPCEAEDAGKVENHVAGRQLLEGVRDLAVRQFGLMARAVFRCWGIQRTDDFGDIVFNLIDANLMSKTPEDSREDFRGVFDLDDALQGQYEIKLEEAE